MSNGEFPIGFFIDYKHADESPDLVRAFQEHHKSFDGALCREVNTDDMSRPDWIDFAPGRGEATAPAKFVCENCVMRDRCLETAMDNGDSFIRGGTSSQERKQLLHAYYNEKNAGALPSGMTKGQFAVIAREYFYKAPSRKSRKYSYPPKVMRDANCLTTDSALFETIDSLDRAGITKELLTLALSACLTCPNKGVTCGELPYDARSDITVMNGSIFGEVPSQLIPSKKSVYEAVRARKALAETSEMSAPSTFADANHTKVA